MHVLTRSRTAHVRLHTDIVYRSTECSEMTLNIFTSSRTIHFPPDGHDKIIALDIGAPAQQPLYKNSPTTASHTALDI